MNKFVKSAIKGTLIFNGGIATATVAGVYMLSKSDAIKRFAKSYLFQKIYSLLYENKKLSYNEKPIVKFPKENSYCDYAKSVCNQEIVLDTKEESNNVISEVKEIIDKYGFASVADLYEICGVLANYTDNEYGWIDVSGAYSKKVMGGYSPMFPESVRIM